MVLDVFMLLWMVSMKPFLILGQTNLLVGSGLFVNYRRNDPNVNHE